MKRDIYLRLPDVYVLVKRITTVESSEFGYILALEMDHSTKQNLLPSGSIRSFGPPSVDSTRRADGPIDSGSRRDVGPLSRCATTPSTPTTHS